LKSQKVKPNRGLSNDIKFILIESRREKLWSIKTLVAHSWPFPEKTE